MVRVAGLKRRIVAGLAVRAASGMMPRDTLEAIWEKSRDLSERHARLFTETLVPELAGAGIELVRWSDLDRDEQRFCEEAVQGPDLPGAHAAGGRPGAPVPLHLRTLAQPGRDDPQPEDRQGALRAGQGAADLRPVRAAREPALRPARGRHRRAPQAAVPGHGGPGGAHLPGHPQRGPRGRGGRRREPARRAREGAAAPPVRPAGPARGRGVDDPGRAGPAGLRAGRERRGGLPPPRPARPARAAQHRGPEPRGAEVRRVRADHPPAAGRGGVVGAGRRVQGDPPQRRTAAPPLRLVRDLGAAVHRAGRRRPARAGDQADALPHVG